MDGPKEKVLTALKGKQHAAVVPTITTEFEDQTQLGTHGKQDLVSTCAACRPRWCTVRRAT